MKEVDRIAVVGGERWREWMNRLPGGLFVGFNGGVDVRYFPESRLRDAWGLAPRRARGRDAAGGVKRLYTAGSNASICIVRSAGTTASRTPDRSSRNFPGGSPRAPTAWGGSSTTRGAPPARYRYGRALPPLLREAVHRRGLRPHLPGDGRRRGSHRDRTPPRRGRNAARPSRVCHALGSLPPARIPRPPLAVGREACRRPPGCRGSRGPGGVVRTGAGTPGISDTDAEPAGHTLLAGCDVRADIFPTRAGPIAIYKQQSALHVEFPRERDEKILSLEREIDRHRPPRTFVDACSGAGTLGIAAARAGVPRVIANDAWFAAAFWTA
ncbi:STAS/SEC14 domain-containing protein, partial [Methanoculleus chikugoensis]|uniref:STAS/SEC14 domain-containing protein n=1 Tax=Methanoculleus chikugoensis TaxID=118126 RepID=UPI001FB50806